MINAILSGMLSLVIDLVDVILLPIDTLINQFLPDLATAIHTVEQFFDYILSFIPWICSWINFPSWFVTFVIAYFTFKLTVPLGVHTVKVALAWYDKLKP